jgi:hypothetical protein
MERRKFVAAFATTAAGLAANPLGAAPPMPAEVPLLPPPPDMEEYLTRVDQGLARIGNWSPTAGVTSFHGDRAATDALARTSLQAVFLTGMLGDLPIPSPPTFSPDGRWGYVARDGDSVSVIVDGAVAARAAWAADLTLGRAARQAYVTAEGDRMVVVDEQTRHVVDLVVTGTLQFVADGTVWACLAGDRAKRELFVVVNGVRVGRPFDWPEIVRRMHDGEGAAAVRAWVVAEATRAITK